VAPLGMVIQLGCHGDPMDVHGDIYHLVIQHSYGKSIVNGSFAIAMLNNQRVMFNEI